jgi:type IV pilus assembly protein PilC
VNGRGFRYAARTGAGEAVRGFMQAPSAEVVVASLRSRALFVTAVEPEHPLMRALGRPLQIGMPGRPALLAFFRSFAALVRAGIALRRALDVTIARSRDATLREALRAVAADVDRGSALSTAFRRRPRVFPALHVAMIAAGEAGGILDDVLERLAGLLERDADVRRKLRAALAYPAILLIAAGGLIAFVLAHVIPQFAQMFASFHVPLPPATALLLNVGTVLADPRWWTGCVVVTFASTAALVIAARLPLGALALDRLRLRLPLLGPLLRRAITARIARTLGTLLRSGMDLTAALGVVSPVAGSAAFAAALSQVDGALRAGEPLTAALERHPLFDPLAVALIGVGEETGLLDDMLLRVATYFEADVEAGLTTLGATLEPALLGGLGIVVGFIVFSVFVPLYGLIGSVGQ